MPASASFERPFVADHEILQREQKAAAPGLTVLAYAVVVAIALSLLALLAWGLHRLSAAVAAGSAPARRARFRRAPQAVERPISAASPSSVRSSPNA